jgi:hypothetical protein
MKIILLNKRGDVHLQEGDGTSTRGPNAKLQFYRNRLYRLHGLHSCLVFRNQHGLLCNNRFNFQVNVVKVNRIRAQTVMFLQLRR